MASTSSLVMSPLSICILWDIMIPLETMFSAQGPGGTKVTQRCSIRSWASPGSWASAESMRFVLTFKRQLVMMIATTVGPSLDDQWDWIALQTGRIYNRFQEAWSPGVFSLLQIRYQIG